LDLRLTGHGFKSEPFRTADDLPTYVVTHQLQVECRTGKVWRPKNEVLPPCHATNSLQSIQL